MLRCPLTYAANGQQHSSSYCVCNPQHHGVVQGGALASATGGPVSARYLPLSLFPTKTKEMRITRANHLAERIKITSFSLSQMMASMMAAVTIVSDTCYTGPGPPQPWNFSCSEGANSLQISAAVDETTDR